MTRDPVVKYREGAAKKATNDRRSAENAAARERATAAIDREAEPDYSADNAPALIAQRRDALDKLWFQNKISTGEHSIGRKVGDLLAASASPPIADYERPQVQTGTNGAATFAVTCALKRVTFRSGLNKALGSERGGDAYRVLEAICLKGQTPAEYAGDHRKADVIVERFKTGLAVAGNLV